MTTRAQMILYVLEVYRRYPDEMVDAAERILRDKIVVQHQDAAVPPRTRRW